jgi:hypothetical protein
MPPNAKSRPELYNDLNVFNAFSLTWCFAGMSGLCSDYFQVSGIVAPVKADGIPLEAGELGEHRHGGLGAGEPDLVSWSRWPGGRAGRGSRDGGATTAGGPIKPTSWLIMM